MIQWLEFSSKAIKDFPMGDPHQRTFPVYLPPNYEAKRKQPYPVVFILSGFGSRSAKLVWEDSAYREPLPVKFDQAIMQGDLPEVILVFPDSVSKLGCSQYVNSPAIGNYMDYLCDEIVTLIDENFNTHASRDFRGVAGHSSGGFGALIFGLMRPDRFRYLCSSAGDSFYAASLLSGVNNAIIQIEKHGSVPAFLDWFFSLPNPDNAGSDAFMALLVLAMAPCFAPNLNNKPLLGDVFFDLKTGAIIEEVWQKYLAWDPVYMVDKHVDNLKQLKWIHLEAGAQDEYALQLGHRQIAAKLTQHKINYRLDEYPGKHGGHHWRYVERVKLMLQQMV